MSLSFKGYKESVATFMAAESLTSAGVPVKMTASNTVGPCAAGEDFCGLALELKVPYVTAQTGGFVSLPYSGTAPQPGYVSLAADGSGGVKSVASGGRQLLVINADTAKKTVGFML